MQIVETTGDQTMLLQAQPSVSFGTGGSSSSLVITVDATTQYQQMDGFGGSLTDSSAWLIWNKLSASQQATLMQQLFSPSSGIGISFLRQPMGATDFSASGNYSYDDMPAGQTDPNLTNFSVTHDTAYIIPLVKQALSINPNIKVVALPWSPPAWMKTTGTMNGGNMNTAYFPSLAQYFVDFAQAYQQQGIPIYALSVQNEPLYSTTGYPSEYLAASDESTFIANNLGPALSAAGLGSVKIFAYEHNWDNTAYPESVLGSSAAPVRRWKFVSLLRGRSQRAIDGRDGVPGQRHLVHRMLGHHLNHLCRRSGVERRTLADRRHAQLGPQRFLVESGPRSELRPEERNLLQLPWGCDHRRQCFAGEYHVSTWSTTSLDIWENSSSRARTGSIRTPSERAASKMSPSRIPTDRWFCSP